jgi:hypothetical protein
MADFFEICEGKMENDSCDAFEEVEDMFSGFHNAMI